MVSIICVGNEYQLDDGFGPAVARYLEERYEFPPEARVVDRAVMGYAIVPDLRECDAVVVVDALDGTGTEPGTVLSFEPSAMATSTGMMSLHEVRFADVLAAAEMLGASCVGHCFGAQVARRGGGALERGLSAPVESAVAPTARAVARYLAVEHGIELKDRWRASGDARAVLGDPGAYVRAALSDLGLEGPLAEGALAEVSPGMADYEADDLVESLIAATGRG